MGSKNKSTYNHWPQPSVYHHFERKLFYHCETLRLSLLALRLFSDLASAHLN